MTVGWWMSIWARIIFTYVFKDHFSRLVIFWSSIDWKHILHGKKIFVKTHYLKNNRGNLKNSFSRDIWAIILDFSGIFIQEPIERQSWGFNDVFHFKEYMSYNRGFWIIFLLGLTVKNSWIFLSMTIRVAMDY